MPKDTITVEIDSSISGGLTIYKDQPTTIDLFDIFQIKDVNGSTITTNISEDYDTQTDGTALTGEKIVKVYTHPSGYARVLSSDGTTGRWGRYFQDSHPYDSAVYNVIADGDYYSDPNLFYTTAPDNHKDWIISLANYDFFKGKGPWPSSPNALGVVIGVSSDKSNITTSSSFQSALVRPLLAAQDTSFTLLKNEDNSSIISGKTISKIKQIGVGYKGNTTYSRTHSSSKIDYGVLFTDGTAATVTLSTGTEPYTIPVAGVIPTSGSIEIKATKQTEELEEFPVTNATRATTFGSEVVVTSEVPAYLVNKLTNQVVRNNNNTAIYGTSFPISMPVTGAPSSSFVNTPLFTVDSTGHYILYRGSNSYTNLNIYRYANSSWSEITGAFTLPTPIDAATRILKHSNNFYIFTGSIVYKVTSTGTVTTLAGSASQRGYTNATGTSARFGQFVGTPVVDSSGNIYVCDSPVVLNGITYGEPSIRKITPSGVVTTFYSQQTVTGTIVPIGGDIKISAFSTKRFLEESPITSGVRKGMYGSQITIRGNRTGYLVDTNTNTSFRNASGALLSSNTFEINSPITSKGVFYPSISPMGSGNYTTHPTTPNIIYSLYRNGNETLENSFVIYGYDLNTALWSEVTPVFLISGVLHYSLIFNIIRDSIGNFYAFTDSQVFKITPNGTVSSFAGSSQRGYVDGTGGSARFGKFASRPVIDSNNNIYVCDSRTTYNSQSVGEAAVRKITPNGVVSTFYKAGINPSTFLPLFIPISVAIKPNGDVVVVNLAEKPTNNYPPHIYDYSYGRIEIISQTQQVTVTSMYASEVWVNGNNVYASTTHESDNRVGSAFYSELSKIINNNTQLSYITGQLSSIPSDPLIFFTGDKILFSSYSSVFEVNQNNKKTIISFIDHNQSSSNWLPTSVSLNHYKIVSVVENQESRVVTIPYNASVNDLTNTFSGFLPSNTQYSRPSIANQDTWSIVLPEENLVISTDNSIKKQNVSFLFSSSSILPNTLGLASLTQSGNTITIQQPHKVNTNIANPFEPVSIALTSGGAIAAVNRVIRPDGHPARPNGIDSWEELGRVEKISLSGHVTTTGVFATNVWSDSSGGLYTTIKRLTYSRGGATSAPAVVVSIYKILNDTQTTKINSSSNSEDNYNLLISNGTGDLFLYAYGSATFGEKDPSNSIFKITSEGVLSKEVSFTGKGKVNESLLLNYKLVRVNSSNSSQLFTLPYDASVTDLSFIFSSFLPLGTQFFTPTISGQSTWRIEMPQTSLSVSSDFTIPQNPIIFSIQSESIGPLELPPPQVSNTNGVVVISQSHLAPSSLSQHKLNCSINWTLLPNPRSAPIVDIIASAAQNVLLAYYSDDTHEMLIGPKDRLSRGFLLGKTVKKIATGKDHTLVLCTDGSLASYGINTQGVLGVGVGVDELTRPRSVVRGVNGIPRDLKVVDIAAGENSSYAVTDDGNVYVWGHDNAGHLGPIAHGGMSGSISRPVRLLKDTIQTFTNRLFLSSKSLPSGLQIDEEIPTTGRLYGSPNRVGSYTSKIKVDYVDIILVLPDEYKFNFKGTTYATLPINVVGAPTELSYLTEVYDEAPNSTFNPNEATTGSSTGEVLLHGIPIPTSSLVSSLKSVSIQFTTTRKATTSPLSQSYNIKFGGTSILDSMFAVVSDLSTTTKLSVKISKTSSAMFKFETTINCTDSNGKETIEVTSKSIAVNNFEGVGLNLYATNAAGSNAPIVSNYGEIKFLG